MRVVHADSGGLREPELRIERPDATVADLAAALGVAGGLVIDGRLVPGELGIHECGLLNGSLIGTADGGVPQRAAPGGHVAMLRIVAGTAAGRSIPLPPGNTVIGRRPDGGPGPAPGIAIYDGAVSRRHCVLSVSPAGQVTITDLGSTNGTAVGGVRLHGSAVLRPADVVSLGGAVLLRVVPAAEAGPPVPTDPLRDARPGGTVPFSRAPRPARRGDVGPVLLPAMPARRKGPMFSVSMLAGPVVMAAVLVAMKDDIRYAAISALSPLMMVGNVVEERARSRFGLRRGLREFGERVSALERELTARAVEETALAWDSLPDLAEIVACAAGPGRRLWERRPDAPDFLRLSAGIADLPWTPPVRSEPGAGIAEAVDEVLARVSAPRPVPVAMDLSHGRVLGIQGDRAASLALACSLVCQAAVTSGPADLLVAVCADADRAGDWDWAKWLPHTVDCRGGGSARLLAAGAEEVDELARDLLRAGKDAPGPAVLIVADGAKLLEGRPCPLRELLAGRAGDVLGVDAPLPAYPSWAILAMKAQPAASMSAEETRRVITPRGVPGFRSRMRVGEG
jgi:S-DNA-T family DNA segregation ATPase FtsK/SpoIIIE